ncbi:MBL fold metallo-hydrolase [Dethiosulfatarculus sandiegensis]|uniref:MBL fold metallo-hydrolase n=1 Tax=Dethiosulfatarculus sandiegensis TaxID=1429043 RepID=UPI0005CA5BF9|nr:MBL fold metallo-hydrolase [Dethiosulfatarculus sandiegensis]
MAQKQAIEDLLESLHWLGHDCFRLDTNQGAIYFDPFELGEGPQACLVLASHDHFDHCVAEDVAKIKGPDTVIVTEKDCAAKLEGDVRVVSPGDKLEVNGIGVKAVPAYNTDKDFHPKGNKWLGFVVTVNGVSIYHAGDTDHIPEMTDLKPDIALLPVSGTYVMTADQAAEAARAIKPGLAIPMHYGAIVGDASDAERFAQLLEGDVPVRILQKG